MLTPEMYDEYLPYLDESEMSDSQKKEFLEQIWLICTCFVDIGFGQSPMQLAQAEQQRSEKFQQFLKQKSALSKEIESLIAEDERP